MPTTLSRSFGLIDYVPGEQFVFPDGLPGFPGETEFLPVELPGQFPLLYLQSLGTPELCFVTLPVKCLIADFELAPEAEEPGKIGLGVDSRLGSERMLCLGLVCFDDDGTASANLRAPLVINIKNRMGVQMVQSEDRYPIRFPLATLEEVAVCS